MQGILELPDLQEDMYADLLDTMGDLKRTSHADYELCTALLSMVLKEKYFVDGQVQRLWKG